MMFGLKLSAAATYLEILDIAHATRSVDITITGKASFDLEFIYNSDAGWLPVMQKGESVDGEKVYNFEMNGDGTSWCEAVVNLQNKSEGPLQVTKMEFKDEAGNVLLTVGGDSEAAASDPLLRQGLFQQLYSLV